MESVKQKSGILLIDKRPGPTSRQVVNNVSYLLKTKKVGHIGTLDPFASGLLILTVNRATKIGAYLEALDKTYIAKLKLGEKTDTGDFTGEIIEKGEVYKKLDLDKISAVLASFVGKRNQIPPMYSALKRDGKPLYKYAREGLTLQREPREITIFSLRLLSYQDDIIEFEAKVSKGTYIRTLGEDIAQQLGSVGHLRQLRRTAIGAFQVQDALSSDDANYEHLIDMTKALSHLPHVEISEEQIVDVKNGKPQTLDSDERLLLLTHKNKAIALYEKRENRLYYCRRGLFE
ncbi:MAG: tRNA pseudouridine(55) synthase TruB [Bacilli bacterium]|jgi:tRNA pseudouridine55 synthase|nr:tRNA pseudouridine(55) synthase TruB [Bacilli bacterium]